ncbi:family 2 glycoside hydrolase [Schleiferilactobacillus perolens DSM 12744]|uniref:Family 2 glycoside hydrolase n=1 Tax=Schleiferilactobacillus perolens DSM 12744 TaxID=1423792 RepID=A0A0R1MIP1_9LACO|nr:family 2 glycoside hydrolase [Schleiferilactobacillus perolens DSM 12744]
MIDVNREQYPRPQFVRQGPWQNLNGAWHFAFDDQDIGRREAWFQNSLPDPVDIQVPFVYQSKLSGINDQSIHDIVWYQRPLAVTKKDGEHYLLHFGAVDYRADVYVNGTYVGAHVGGDGSFSFDVTDALTSASEQTVTVRVEDHTFDETIPRGKQSWAGAPVAIWYTNSTGIWQTVWLETVPAARLTDIRMTPDLDHASVTFDADFSSAAIGATFAYEITFGDTVVAKDTALITDPHLTRSVELLHRHILRTACHSDGWTWTPEHPNLFSVTFTVLTANGHPVDQVDSYFGLRKISTENGMVLLNNKPYYQRLVLDQGYWPDGLLTAPTDEALKTDIELAKKMGFNGARKHQKVEDPQFLYWADKLGYLVWEEVASVPIFSPESVNRLIDAWQETIKRDYNHPSIVMWVPLNEGWGVDQINTSRQQQHFSESLYHMIHALDDTRLVESNDGWDNTQTDVVGIHNYTHGAKDDTKQYDRYRESMKTVENLINMSPGYWPVFAPGFHYTGQPIILTEFGGISFASDRPDGWGYTTAATEEEYLSELHRLLSAIADSQGLCGYCYTQLTDVQQEVNGLLTAERKPKAPMEKIQPLFAFPVTGRLADDAAAYRQPPIVH